MVKDGGKRKDESDKSCGNGYEYSGVVVKGEENIATKINFYA